MKILVVEDDTEVAAYLKKGLSAYDYVVDCADNGNDGLSMAISAEYDLAIVDRMLPGLDGLALVKALRGAGKDMPVMVLSAMAEVDDRVEGLKAGGDDYLTKPFAFSELLARIEVLLRRGSTQADQVAHNFKVADLELDLLKRVAKRGGRVLDLQPKEFQLLEYLIRHPGQVVTRTMLLEQVWEYHFDPQTNVVNVHISRLRNKVDKGFDKRLIRTVRGAGYMISEDNQPT